MRRKVLIGVVCANGIGFSSLLSSSLVQAFPDKIKVKTLSATELDKSKLEHFDIVVSTFSLADKEVPYIQVNPMLSEADLQKIEIEIEYYAYQKPAADDRLFESTDLHEAAIISNEINSILDSFQVYQVAAAICFDEIMRLSGEYLGGDEASKRLIYEDLQKRERLSTQVVPEFELVLLHAKTNGVNDSKFILLLPDEEWFLDEYLQQIKVVIVMLIPKEDERTTRAISKISRAVFEEEAFLGAIKQGNKKQIKDKMQYYLKQYFMECLRYIYENG